MLALVAASGALPRGVQATDRRAGPPPTRPASQPAGTTRNLVFNGDFERADASGRLPEGWATKHPGNVRLVGGGGQRGRVVEMTGEADLMGAYGVDLLSGKIPVKPNTRYRCTGTTRSTGPSVMVFVKGYAPVTRSIGGETKTFDDVVYQMREHVDASSEWRPFNLDFDIQPTATFSDHQHKVQHLRIMLWGYWPAGSCWFDDIRFEEVGPMSDRPPRHPEAVTHVGLPPRLGRADDEAAGGFDEQQLWIDAMNAWRGEDYDQALKLAQRLIERAAGKGDYRLLAARVLVSLKRWPEADEHARWLLAEPAPETQPEGARRQVEPWHRDWARVLRAEVLLRTGRRDEAKKLLQSAVAPGGSDHARLAAQALLDELQAAATSPP